MKKNEVTRRNCGLTFTRKICLLAVMLGVVLSSSTWAQTLTLTNISGFKLFAGGGGYSGAYTNVQIRAVLSGDFTTTPNPVTLTASSLAGLTTIFLTNNFTNSQTLYLNFGVTNISKGIYPITISASTNGQPIGNSLVIPLIAGTLWTNNNPAGDVTWANANNWSGGTPTTGDDVMFQDAGSSTNYLASSVTVDSLTIIRNITATNHDLTLATGTTLSVVGTNGFAINEDAPQTPATSKSMRVNIAGDATLLVSNSAANVAINGDSTGSTGTTLTMTNLGNFKAYVSRFGVADVKFAVQGGIGAQMARVDFAKTNLIRAGYVSADLSIANTNYLDGAINFINNTMDYNNGSAYTFNLGQINTFEADSMIFGQARSGSSASLLQFNSLFAVPSSTVTFRNTSAGRVSLIAVAADSFGPGGVGSNTKFKLSLLNGYVDMLVDTMWIGRNRFTNSSSANPIGELLFSYGTVDVNTLRLGYQAYTNDSYCNGKVTVGQGTNTSLLVVNTDLNLGYTSGDYSSGVNAARVTGQVVIGTNGTVRAKQITVGTLSTNNTVTIQNGGLLLVSNTVASSAKGLTTLAMTGGSLTLPVTAGATNVYVTNFTTSAGSKINIASLSGFASYPATNVIIKYEVASDHSPLGIGTLPAGFNNVQVRDNTTDKTIELIISTNAPQTLVWKGPGSTWDNTSYNWVTATNTSIAAKFTDGDTVIFNDTVGAPATVTISQTVAPNQIGTGIYFSNSVNNYTIESTYPNGISAGTLVKQGTASLGVNGYANVAVVMGSGKLTGSGTIASVNASSGTFFGWTGTLTGGASIGGGATNSGSINGGLAVTAGGAFTNNGTVSGVFSVATNGLIVNNSTMNGFLSASTIDLGGRVVHNSGELNGFSIAVYGTFEDKGVGQIKLSSSATGGQPAGLDIKGQGTFLPGGSGIGTTTVQETSSGDPLTSGNVKLNPGSTTIVKVDPGAVGQQNSKVLCNVAFMGGSQSTVATNGGTIIITNVGVTAFAAGQSFKIFGSLPSDGSFTPAIFPLNTTNSYPIITPAYPAFGLTWDLSQVIYDGTISIVASTLPQTPTNIVVTSSGSTMTLSWPSDYTGWRLQQQTNSLSVGISTNWTLVAGSTATNSVSITNDPAIPSAFFRLSYPYP